jgi:hypothetical protein
LAGGAEGTYGQRSSHCGPLASAQQRSAAEDPALAEASPDAFWGWLAGEYALLDQRRLAHYG